MNFSSRFQFFAQLSKFALNLIQKFFFQTLLMLFIALFSQLLKIVTKQQKLFITFVVKSAVQTYYFDFLFIQIFFIVSLFLSFTIITNQIYHNFDFVSKTLAQNLSKTNDFFFIYFITSIFHQR